VSTVVAGSPREQSAAITVMRAPRSQRALLVAVTIAALAVAVTSLIHTARGFFWLDFAVTWVEGGVQVDQVPAATTAQSAGLQEGDLIIAIDGMPVERVEDPLFVLAAGSEHLLAVRDPAQLVRDVVYRPATPRVDLVYLARSVVAMLGLGCALIAVLTTQRREAATFLLVAVAVLMLASIPHRTAAAELHLKMLHRMAGAAVPFLLLRMFVIFPEGRRSVRTWDVLTVLAMAACAAIVLVPGAEVWWPVAAATLRVCFGLAIAGGVVIQITRWRATVQVARIRRQMEWAALGLFVGLVPHVAVVVVPRSLGIAFEPFSWMAVLPIVAVPAGFLAALSQYRLWDLEPISRDVVSATLVMAAGGLIFAATNHFLVAYAGGLGSLRNLFAFATGVLLVVLLQPIRFQVARFLDQWLYHGRPAPRGLLTQSTREFARATDPRQLLEALTEALHEGLELELVATYLRASDGAFVRVTGEGDDLRPRLPSEITDHLFPHEDEQELASEGYAVRVPLERTGTIHGLLYFGLRRGIFPLGSEGREVVATFAAQAGLGLESARLLDDLRQQAEEYRILHANTQRIIESSAAGILVCDATGRILSANAEASGIFGHEPASLVGQALESLVDLPETWRPYLPLHAMNTEASTSGEPPRRLVMAVSVLELDSGSFNGRVVVLQDVSEFRRLQNRLREQERLAGLGRLASGLAHEINTPLTGIASFAQMLGEMTPGDDPRSELVNKLVNQSFRVSRIVANLHAAVRGGGGERSAVDLVGLVSRAAKDAARSVTADSRLDLIAEDSQITVWAAPAAVELAVSNLVRNAFEASPPDGRVRVEVVNEPRWGEVRVDDTGPGIPEEMREKVFEPFYSTKTERGGTGLGLAITRDMIAQLGGDVRLEPSPSGGTRAVIRLPQWEESEPHS